MEGAWGVLPGAATHDVADPTMAAGVPNVTLVYHAASTPVGVEWSGAAHGDVPMTAVACLLVALRYVYAYKVVPPAVIW